MKKSLVFVFTFMCFIYSDAQDTRLNEYVGPIHFRKAAWFQQWMSQLRMAAYWRVHRRALLLWKRFQKTPYLVSYSGTVEFS